MTETATCADAYKLFHDGTLALAQVEHTGLRVDVDYLKAAIEDVTQRIKEKETILKADPVYRTWRRLYGEKTKLNAPEQLAKVLFDQLGYKSTSMTSGGAKGRGKQRAKADKGALERVDLPFVKEYLRYKALQKVKSTYLGGLTRELVGDRIHPSFGLHTARTYRSSCYDPNGQNFPMRDEEQAELVRTCIIPSPGNRLVEFDFKGAEVTVAACYHKDPTMLEYCRDPSKDMHRDMASLVFKVKKSLVSKMTRYVAKNMVVFPFFYGSVWFQCAPAMWEGMDRLKCTVGDILLKQHLASKGITELGDCSITKGSNGKDEVAEPAAGTFAHHLKKIEQDFWSNRFPKYAAWKKKWYEDYRERGYFDLLTGFRCEGLYVKNEAVNYPVQGAAFHCLLWCLIQMQRWLRKNKMLSRIVLQVHDSMLLDVHPSEFDAVLAQARHIMTVALPKVWQWLIVPISVEVEAGGVDESWFQKKPVGAV